MLCKGQLKKHQYWKLQLKNTHKTIKQKQRQEEKLYIWKTKCEWCICSLTMPNNVYFLITGRLFYSPNFFYKKLPEVPWCYGSNCRRDVYFTFLKNLTNQQKHLQVCILSDRTLKYILLSEHLDLYRWKPLNQEHNVSVKHWGATWVRKQ